MNYASFLKRFMAIIIDWFILLSISIVVNRFIFLGWIISLLINCIYYTFFLASVARATPGKYLMKISVMTISGERLTNKAAFIRYLSSIASAALLCFGYVLALFTEKKQTLHDLLAGTIVVEETFTPDEGLLQAWMNQIKTIL